VRVLRANAIFDRWECAISENITENLGAFGWSLDAADVALIAGVLARATPIHGDCGDEYRRPPFLTAQG
jgi:hypothetical protein